MYSDRFLTPLLDSLLREHPRLELFDAHTHAGVNDPSGFTATIGQLEESLDLTGGRAAVFPLKEPSGYAEPNRRLAEHAERTDGRLVAFCRIDPEVNPVGETEAALHHGARGIKLHPAGEEFEVDDPRLRGVYAIADERRLPIMLHAGPENDPMGEETLRLAERYPGARLILAHGCIPDLPWIFERAPDYPNLFFDTSWWSHSDVIALMRLLPPGQVLMASDLPYCSPLSGGVAAIRCGLEAGLDERQVAGVVGDQMARLAQGADPLDLGPPPDSALTPLDPLLERLYVFLMTGLEPMQRGEEPETPFELAMAATRVADDHPLAETMAAVRRLLEIYEREQERLPQENPFAPGWDLISNAALLARTPAVPVPAEIPLEPRVPLGSAS
jgi:uncharacterized protein